MVESILIDFRIGDFMINCRCGGNLVRVAIDCYQCTLCGEKQLVALLRVPREEVEKELSKSVDNIIRKYYNNKCNKERGGNDYASRKKSSRS